jgi:hypothetical protein
MAVLALAFLLVPGVVFVAGGAGRPLPRERTARTPSPSRGWTFFDDTGHYFTQRLPFRDRAVDANSWVVRHVFGTRPKYGNAGTGPDHALPFGGVRRDRGAGDVQNGGAQAGEAVAAEGRHHWLFLQGELDVTCRPPVGFQTALSRWNALLRILRASGRRAVLVVVPEKSTIYPEYLKPDTPSGALRAAPEGPDVAGPRDRRRRRISSPCAGDSWRSSGPTRGTCSTSPWTRTGMTSAPSSGSRRRWLTSGAACASARGTRSRPRSPTPATSPPSWRAARSGASPRSSRSGGRESTACGRVG